MRLLDRLFNNSKSKNPEDQFKVTITDSFVQVEHPARKTEMIHWVDIKQIKLINTDEGPWLPDLWLSLVGDNSACLIPHGASGYDEVYDKVSKYAGFKFENVIKSMRCTDNAEFLLWRRELND
jgi:hypothetical protein